MSGEYREYVSVQPPGFGYTMGTSLPKRVDEVILVLLELAAAIYATGHRLRFLRWRREYERSIDRLIRSLHPGV
jgi:hypothetical protein